MKLSVFLAIIILLGVATGDARAQEQEAPAGADSVARSEAQRTPVMTVQEAALPVQNAKTADPKAAAQLAGKTQPGAQKKGAAKPAAICAAATTAAATPEIPNAFGSP